MNSASLGLADGTRVSEKYFFFFGLLSRKWTKFKRGLFRWA